MGVMHRMIWRYGIKASGITAVSIVACRAALPLTETHALPRGFRQPVKLRPKAKPDLYVN